MDNGYWNWNGVNVPRTMWQVWTKDGTRYEFADDAWWSWKGADDGVWSHAEPYKWMLTRVVDTHGNTIQYFYERDRVNTWDTPGYFDDSGSRNCADWGADEGNSFNLQFHPNIWLTSITWSGNINTGAPERYKVEFTSYRRLSWPSTTEADKAPYTSIGDIGTDSYKDMDWEYSTKQCGDSSTISQKVAPHQDRVLRDITVYSKQASTWEQVRAYQLEYYDWGYLHGDAPSCSTSSCDTWDEDWTFQFAYQKLALKVIQLMGKDGSSFPTKTTFTYEEHWGEGSNYEGFKYPQGGYARLKTVENGQGGRITYLYDDIGIEMRYIGWHEQYANHHRVREMRAEDGRGNTYTWSYTYGDPAKNSLGTYNNRGIGPNTYPNSASLWYAFERGTRGYLLIGEEGQFRGHKSVTVTDPNNSKTEHYFYMGDEGGCEPADFYDYQNKSFTSNPDDNACWNQLVKYELLAGKEYRTIWKDTSQNKVKEVLKEYNVTVYGINDKPFYYPEIHPNDSSADVKYNYTVYV